MTEAIYSYINYLAAYSLILSVMLIIKDREKVRGAFAISGFIGCVLFYLIIDLVNNPILKSVEQDDQ